MSVVFVHGGQGCEVPHMGLHVPGIDPVLDTLTELAGWDARRVLTRGGPRWARTEVIQPLLVAVGWATAQVLPIRTPAVGHSLGRFTAWAAEQPMLLALEAALHRGEAMARVPGGMVALPAGARAPQGLVLAVRNPGQDIFSGPELAVRAAVAAGASRLPVTGPWHHPCLQEAGERLVALGIPATLAADLYTPFDGVAMVAAADAATDVVLVGPARPWARVFGDRRVWQTDTADGLAATLRFLEGDDA